MYLLHQQSVGLGCWLHESPVMAKGLLVRAQQWQWQLQCVRDCSDHTESGLQYQTIIALKSSIYMASFKLRYV
jgi:hypothetical protein